MDLIASLFHVESKAAPHQSVIVHQQNRAGHNNSLYLIESLEKEGAHNLITKYS
jgi:hypothetical protein